MSDQVTPARVRFAPSPTGHMHLGSARTALYNYLLARQTGGKFILRIEDTDVKRYTAGAEQELIDGLKWLGIDWDEGPQVGGPFAPYRQSERKDIYQEYARQLIESDHAFYCFCTPERLARVREEQQKKKEPPHYDGTCRRLAREEAEARVNAGERHVIRFKTPKESTTTVHDHLRGDITVENRTLDDYILVKSDGWALYHLAAMVDDHLMQVTHVIRGSEWLPSFPLHVLIRRAFGWQDIVWIHLSVFLKPSGKGKMSKRESADLIKDGHSIFVKDLQELGYTPEGVVNWISLMGWSYDDHTEFFTLPDLVEKFSIDHLNPSPAAINFSKLDHFNGLHIRSLDDRELAKRLLPFFIDKGIEADFETVLKIAPIVKERMATLDEVVPLAGFIFKDSVNPDPVSLVAKGMTAKESASVVVKAIDLLSPLAEMTAALAEPVMREYVEASGYTAGQVFGIMREAITGQHISPPLFESMEIIGKEKVIERLKNAAAMLEKIS